MPSDTDSSRVNLVESFEHGLGKLVGYVGVHVVVRGPWRGRCVNVEASARAEVIALVFAFDANTT